MENLSKSKVTITLVAINLIAFVFSYLTAGLLDEPHFSLTLLRIGALYNPFTLSDQPWRIITSMFLHGGLLHIAFNMYALFSVGMSWERYIGSVKWLAVYIVTGLAASLSSLWWNLFSIGVGASGAIFGIFGFVIVELFKFNRYQKTSNGPLLVRFGLFLGVNILLAEALHADNAAHIGGLVCGMMLSAARTFFKRMSLLPEAATLAVLMVVFFLLPRTQVHYYNAFQRVLANEEASRDAINNSSNTSDQVAAIRKVNEEWKLIAHEVDIIHPMIGDLADDTLALLAYVRVRIKENEYRTKLIERESYIYMDSIEALQAQSDSLPGIKYILNHKEAEPKVERELPARNGLKPVTVFYDSNWVETPYRPFEYYRTGQRDSLGRWQGPVRDYFKNNQVQMKGSYLDDLHHGIFIYYTRNQTYEAAGRLDHDQRIGKWEIFHPNGKLEREVYYGDNEYVQNVWDSTGRQMIINGSGVYEEKRLNGTIEETGSYREGLKQGLWTGYHSNGKKYFEETFFNGRLISGKSISLSGKTFTYDGTSLLALPNGGLKAFQEYVRNAASLYQVKNPGSVKMYFRVTTDNRITDIIIQKSLGAEADAWAKEILLKGPRWNPAQLHGQERTDGFGFAIVDFF